MLVPLTVALYVPGTLDDDEKVLIDVYTGYFIEEKTAERKIIAREISTCLNPIMSIFLSMCLICLVGKPCSHYCSDFDVGLKAQHIASRSSSSKNMKAAASESIKRWIS